MTNKTRKNKIKNAKKGTMMKCKLKTFRAKKYQSIYGSAQGGSIRTNKQYFY